MALFLFRYRGFPTRKTKLAEEAFDLIVAKRFFSPYPFIVRHLC